MFSLIMMIVTEGLRLLQVYRVGGDTGTKIEGAAEVLIGIIAKAKAAYEKETGQPLDVNKIQPFIPLE
jgi:hypothetical protein